MTKIKAIITLVSFSILLGISCLSCSRFSNKINNLFRNKFYNSIALLQSTPGELGDEGKMATGFAVDSDHILTAGHFCEAVDKLKKKEMAGDKITVVRSDKRGLPRIPIPATIVTYNRMKDVCILFAKKHGMRSIPMASSLALLTTEDKVTVIGAPYGFFPVRREGRIISSLAYRFQQFNGMIFIAVNIQAGNSGSPVIKDGEVIGMVAILPHHIHETALAVPINEIKEFLNKTIYK